MVWTIRGGILDAVVAAPRALLGRTIVGPAAVRIRDGRIVEVSTLSEALIQLRKDARRNFLRVRVR